MIEPNSIMIFTRAQIASEFFCERCKKHKKSRNTALAVDEGKEVTICNGCYGELLSKR